MADETVIIERLTRVLVAVLGVTDDDVTPDATLRGDLRAESIDFLDIVFRLEREFGIAIPRGELFPDSVLDGGPGAVRTWGGSGALIAQARSQRSHADLDESDGHPGPDDDRFTVGFLARYVASRLDCSASLASVSTE
ncbi:MAG TPA: acyl carrier protein [Isosphaeraceae bacterium]